MASSLLLRRRPLAALLTAAAVAVPLAGCGTDSSSSGGGNASADPASFLPATAPVYLEAQVRPGGDLKANFDAVAGKILHTSDPGGKIVGLIDKGLDDDGKTYAKDIEPWLGQRLGVAITGVRPKAGGGGDDVDLAAAIAAKDDDAAEKFVASAKGATEREYRGVKYRYKADDDMAAAVVDHVVLLGTERGFKSAIDARNGSTLNEGAEFKKARETVGTDGLAFVYLDPVRTWDAIVATATSRGSSQAGAAQQLNMAKGLITGTGLRSIAAKLDVAQDAIRVDAAAIGLKKGLSGAAGGDGPGAAAAVPEGSLLSVGIGDVGGTFKSALGSLGKAGATGGVDPAMLLQGLKSQLGFDVEKDLLSWMGDAGLFVRGSSLMSLNGALVVTSKDPAASKAAIPKLRKLVESLDGRVSALRGAPSGATGFAVRTGSLPGAVEVAAKDDKFVIAFGDGALAAALGGGAKLGDSQPYKTAAGLLGDTKPSLFLDTPQIVKLIGEVAGTDEDFTKAKPTLEAFGPAAAGASTEGDVTHLKVAVSVP